jgi:hypothetical protein
LRLTQAIAGVLNSRLAEGLSSRTIETYLFHLTMWVECTGDRDISKVTSQDISA